MSPKPTVENTVITRYSAPVWLRGSLKCVSDDSDSERYTAAKVIRNSGIVANKAWMARRPGMSAFLTRWSCHARTSTKTAIPTPRRNTDSWLVRSVNGIR